MSRIKLLSITTLAVLLAAAMIAMPVHAQVANDTDTSTLAKAKPAVKCNVVKIQVKVDNIPVDANTLAGQVTLQGQTLNKVVNVDEEADAKTAIVFNFKKLNPCPTEGTGFFGNVNGTNFIDTIDSLKKPNKVSLSLP